MVAEDALSKAIDRASWLHGQPAIPASGFRLSLKDDESAVIGLVRRRRTRALSAVQRMQDDWLQNFAHYLGYQWDTIAFGSIAPALPTPKWRIRLTDNHVKPVVNGFVAKILQTRPAPLSMPASNDESDVLAARACDEFLQWHRDDERVDRTDLKVALWSTITGTGFWKVFWDDAAGPDVEWEAPPPQEGAEPEVRIAPAGAVRVRSRSPHDVLLDPDTREWADLPWLIDRVRMHWDDALALYGSTMEGLAPGRSSSSGDGERGVSTHFGDLDQNPTSGDTESVDIDEMWERPTPRFPGGRFVTVIAGERVAQYAALPYGNTPSSFPYAPLIVGEVPGRIHGRGVVTDIRPLQEVYNRTISQAVENQNLMGRPKWTVAKNSGIREGAITSQPGEVIEFNAMAGARPEPVRFDPTPMSTFRLAEIIKRDLYDAAQFHEVSQGDVPAGIESGRAMAYLAQLDTTWLGPSVRSLEMGQEDVARWILRVFQAQPDHPTIMIAVLGANRVAETKAFSASKIRSHDVRITPGSLMPENRILREESVERRFQLGIIRDPQEARRLLGVRGHDEVKGDYTKIRSRAQAILMQLKEGMGPGELALPPADLMTPERITIIYEEADAFLWDGEFTDLPVTTRENIVAFMRELQRMKAELSAREAEAWNSARPPPPGGTPTTPRSPTTGKGLQGVRPELAGATNEPGEPVGGETNIARMAGGTVGHAVLSS